MLMLMLVLVLVLGLELALCREADARDVAIPPLHPPAPPRCISPPSPAAQVTLLCRDALGGDLAPGASARLSVLACCSVRHNALPGTMSTLPRQNHRVFAKPSWISCDWRLRGWKGGIIQRK